MRTRIVLITLISVVVAGCDLLPQKPIDVTKQDNVRLCQLAADYYASGDARSYQNVRNELAKRNALGSECVTIAQIEFNRLDRDQARRNAYAQALRDFGNNVANQPPPYQPAPNVNCTSYTQAGVTQTSCH